MADYEFTARIKDAEVLESLNRISNRITELSKTGSDAFRNISAAAKVVGIGALAGGVGTVTRGFIGMGQAAARGFAELIKGAIDSAEELESVKEVGAELKETFSDAIVDGIRQNFQDFNNYLSENKDSLDIVAGSLGDLVGQVANFTGDQIIEFIQNLDSDKVLDFVTNMKDAVSLVEVIIETAKNGNEFIVGFGDGLSDIGDTVKPFRDFMVELITIIGKLNGELNAFQISFSGAGLVANKFLTGGFEGAAQARADVLAQAEEARIKGIEDAAEIVDQLTNAFERNDKAAEDRANNINNRPDEVKPLEEEAKAAEEAAAAQEKYNDARSEYEIDKQRAADDIALKQQRALLDAEIEFAQKREDLARKNAAVIEDIYRKNKQRITDAATDLRRDEEDIAREGARSQIEIEREAAQRRVEIETDFRRELQRIRERFDFDAQEAIRQNDAIAFLRIQRQKDFELQQASQQREEEVQDAETTAIEQRQKLQEQLQAQIEDARIANQRKLEDLRVSLERELQEQRIKYARDVQEAKIAEDRKRQELARTFQQQQEDFQRAWDRKLQDLIRNYQKEIQIIQQYEAQKARIMAESRAQARAAAQAASADRILLQNYSLQSRGVRANPIIDTPRNRAEAAGADAVLTQNYTGRKFGGYSPGGVDFLVGEHGPELVRLPVPGYVTPNHRLKFNPATNGVINQYNNNSRQTHLNVDALMGMLSPQQIAIVEQLVNQLGMSIYR